MTVTHSPALSPGSSADSSAAESVPNGKTTGASGFSTKLSVNVNKIATIRNARGKDNPDVVQTSLDIIRYGAQGITVHPRPDGRHIRRQDVYDLKKAIQVELNIEGYPSQDFLEMNEDVRPAQCTLVPDPPEALTSNAGFRVKSQAELLKIAARRLSAKNIRSSVFVDPATMEDDEYRLLKEIGIDRVELYTERFAERWTTASQPTGANAVSPADALAALDVVASYRRAAELARAAGLGVNAGHDLSLDNLSALISHIPWIDEVSIGHALICDALKFGLETTVGLYLEAIQKSQSRLA